MTLTTIAGVPALVAGTPGTKYEFKRTTLSPDTESSPLVLTSKTAFRSLEKAGASGTPELISAIPPLEVDTFSHERLL